MKRLLVVVLALLAACGDDGTSGGSTTPDASGEDGGSVATGGDATPRDGGTDGASPAPSCGGPPDSAFDPLARYVAPKLAPTVVVTSVADSGAGSLRAALAAAPAGAVVGFAPALAQSTILLASPLVLVRSVTVDGAGASGLTIDAQRKGSAFVFNGDDKVKLAFFSLRITHGQTTGSGGAISLNGGDLEVEIGGCRFVDNGANEGGALRVGYRGKPAYVHDSVFVGNDGAFPGGSRAGFSGGAISAIGPALHVVRCRFEKNRGTISGALYAIHADPVVEDSVFVENASTGSLGSGAFFSDGGGPGDYGTDYTKPANQIPGEITIRRTRFTRNRGAGDDAGAVEAYAYPLDAVTIEGTVFDANRSDPGRAGALFVHADRTVTLTRTAFVDNTATATGGAIWADGDAAYAFENVLFSGNRGGGDFGGAMRLNVGAKATVTITSATFADNVAATTNGAIWLAGVRAGSVKNSIFSGNTATAGTQQVNFPIPDGGGNIEWPDPRAGTRNLGAPRTLDPLLAPPAAEDGTIVRPPGAKSPAINTAVLPAPAVDGRNAKRSGAPDVGAYEVGAACGK